MIVRIARYLRAILSNGKRYTDVEASLGRLYSQSSVHRNVDCINATIISDCHSRTEVINLLLKSINRPVIYLEIGVRNPFENFDLVEATEKYGVDPGYENTDNPVTFKQTSDDFFDLLDRSEILNSDIRFDLVFIDGLHLAEQVDRDIQNSLRYLSDDGYIVLHDCNPPSEYHAREDFKYHLSPAQTCWNGTTWKAFVKWRSDQRLFSCCVDTDWGIGILSPTNNIGSPCRLDNTFYEYLTFSENRTKQLNLISFSEFNRMISDLSTHNVSSDKPVS